MSKSILPLLLFFSIVSHSQSNKLYQKTYTKQDGLEIDNIHALCFDTDGFLWLGGSNLDDRTIIASDKKLALQRFNGHSFHNIELPKYDNAIEVIQHLYKRKDGKLYVVAKLREGFALLLLDPISSTFKQVKFEGHDFYLDGLSGIFSYQNEDYILIQKDRNVSFRKLNMDLTSVEIFNFTSSKNKFVIESSSIIIPFKNFVMVTDDNFPVKVFNWNGALLKTIDAVDTNNYPKPKRVVIDEVFIKDNTHYVFLFENPNLYKINKEDKSLELVKNNTIYNTNINAINDDLGNTMVFASLKTKVTFNTVNNKKINQDYTFNFDEVRGLKAVSKNLNKDVWLATSSQLHYYKFPNKTVKNYFPDYEFRAIKPLDSTNYLVATEINGWYKINPEKNTIGPYKITLNNKAFIPNSARNFILEDSIMWSHGDAGILKLNTTTKTAEIFKHYPVICMERPNDSIIVYGTNRYHLMQFNTNTNTHSSLVKTDSLFIYDLEIQKHNNLVIAGTDKGLLTYNLATKASQFYNSKTDLKDPFTLMLDYHKEYGYLLGSRTGNIVAFKPEDESFTDIYKDELNAGIATIVFNDNLWWINTFNGIVAFNIEDKTTTRFSEKDGFTHFEANRYSAIKTKKGLLVGMIKGLNYFDPNKLKTQNDSAQLTLLKVKHFNKKEKAFTNQYNRNVFNSNYTITLPSENRALDIDFGLKQINAVSNGYNFKYRLDNKNWVELKDKNTIQFPNLASGNYILEIEAEDYSGHKIGDSLFIDINSKALFYKTWWFFTLVSLSIISFLMWLLFQAKQRKQLQQKFSQGLIQSQEDERKRIARELHDSISQQLTLIKKKAQNTNQEEITSLTHNTLEEVRAISRGLYPPLLKQLGLTESIEQLILEVDEQTNLFVSGDIDEIDGFFNEEQTLNCYRFIQECINNCLKHAHAKALSISALKVHETIEINIKDNGKGFDAINAQKQNSLGLKTIYERIRILKGELNIDSKPNKGTTITAKIPINNG